jgi:hypothetical protein
VAELALVFPIVAIITLAASSSFFTPENEDVPVDQS